jgi:hypothetical protein
MALSEFQNSGALALQLSWMPNVSSSWALLGMPNWMFSDAESVFPNWVSSL